jgi:hypothetical protein
VFQVSSSDVSTRSLTNVPILFPRRSLAGNRITNVSTVLCDDDDEFMDFLVGNLTVNKCDAILCPPGTSSPQGRQVVEEMPCQPCSGESKEERELQAPYYGTFACKSISEEKSILEQLHSLIFVGKLRCIYFLENSHCF